MILKFYIDSHLHLSIRTISRVEAGLGSSVEEVYQNIKPPGRGISILREKELLHRHYVRSMRMVTSRRYRLK
jgi:hypothetical protein